METAQSTVEEVSGNLYIMNNLKLSEISNEFFNPSPEFDVTTIANGFSLNMVPSNCPDTWTIKRISLEEAREIVRRSKTIQSVIGHTDTARIVGDLLKIELKPNRINFTLDPKKHVMRGNPNPLEREELLVAQYTGPRLAEGTTTLPEGAAITFWTIDWFTEYELI